MPLILYIISKVFSLLYLVRFVHEDDGTFPLTEKVLLVNSVSSYESVNVNLRGSIQEIVAATADVITIIPAVANREKQVQVNQRIHHILRLPLLHKNSDCG